MEAIKQHGWRTPVLVIIAGSLIAMIGFGVRSTFGLFLEPLTAARGWDRETFALAMALQNLLWGLAVPFASALSDRFGPSRILSFGALLYGAGVWGMATTSSAMGLQLFAGILTGLGVAFSAFSIALAAMAKVVNAERRSWALGLGTAAGSFGQVLFSPLGQLFITEFGWYVALLLLSASVLIIIPLAWVLPSGGDVSGSVKQQSLGQAVREAMRHRGFVLLTLGFSVCGFHVAFITVHFPAYVRDLGLAPEVGAYSIAIIGVFNIIGSFLSGAAGQRWNKRYGLSFIYFARAIVITALLLAPKTELTIYLFAATIGVLWLSTVPLTSGIVAQVFGVRYVATLFGIVFFSHQVGSFMGVWLGGYLYDMTGSYNGVWWTGVVLGVAAAMIHLPINERPLARLVKSH